MKTSSPKQTLMLASFALWTGAALAASVTVTPNLVNNDYVGKITVTITGLAPGQPVLVEKYADFNGDGQVNAGEPAVQAGLVQDGAQPLIGGVRNVNVPGDEDGVVNGEIHLEPFYPGAEKGLDVIACKYLIKVSNPANGSTLGTGSFEVRQKQFPQGITGWLMAAGTGLALPYVPVVMLPDGGEPVTGMVTDANGNYTLHGPPGHYVVLALAPGFVADLNSGANVSAGAFVTVPRTLPVATCTISGRLKDSASGLGVPGVFIQATTQGGQFVAAFTDSTGYYSVGVLADSWMVEPSSGCLAQAGYVGWQNGIGTSTVGGSVANFDLTVDLATALVYGTVKTSQNTPVPGVGIHSEDQPNRQFDAPGLALPPDARYSVGVRPGNWWVGPDEDMLTALGYIGQGTNLTLTANQARRVDFVLRQPDAHLTGQVVDDTGAPVASINMGASDHQGAWIPTLTDANGNFNLGVVAGTWYLQLSTEDAHQRQLLSPQVQVTLANGETRNNIVVVVQRTAALILGSVRNTGGNPIANLWIWGSSSVNGTNYVDGVRTDASGNYQLNTFNGSWWVSVDGNELQSRGYLAPGGVQTNIAGANVTVDFVVNAAPLRLSILCTNAGNVAICWPMPAEGFILEQASQLLSPPQTTVWTPVGVACVTNPPEVSVTVPLAPGQCYFRLRKP